eukprot:361027-Chlamydomonas_euryale.AAC.4
MSTAGVKVACRQGADSAHNGKGGQFDDRLLAREKVWGKGPSAWLNEPAGGRLLASEAQGAGEGHACEDAQGGGRGWE